MLRPHAPWFSQGDLLKDVPIITTTLHGTTTVKPVTSHGPALLLTQDCTLDKATRTGEPTVQRLHFLPLAAVDHQDRNRQVALRKNALQPYEVLYLGDCAELGESFVTLSESYWLPAGYFEPVLREWQGHSAAAAGSRYLTPMRNATRIGRLDAEQLKLLLTKMNAFWTRQLPEESRTG